MSDKFEKRFRDTSIRLQNWNYGWNGAYFITICTAERSHYFGNIEGEKIKLSAIGILADVFWHEIKNHSKFIKLDAFIVMPNPIHGIIILDGNNQVTDRNKAWLVSTETHTSANNEPKTIGQSRFQNQGKNTISSIIGSYKSAVSKHAHRLGFEFELQSRFYDHIIRDNKSLKHIQNYILSNPQNWRGDKLFK
ncbi:MAG: hypothetical protein PF541_05080 [Prolixibacteraceae bacterium]|jgi:putative transposase|nr:hypothetical protein [Prolixibacteraceae bacterium]